MTDPKEKPGPKVPTRTPKKKTPGIFDNLRKMPQPHPVEEMLGLVPATDDTTPPRGGRGGRPSTPSQNPAPAQKSARKPEAEPQVKVAPERDFTKVANSIVREAVPSGIFGGKSKQLYDYLYSLTRGAIVPRRTIRITKEKLMKGAGIGSDVTLKTNLAKLAITGLVVERVYGGTHGGNEYEVFLPEEAEESGSNLPNPLYPLYPLYTLSKLPPLPPLETTPSRGGLNSALSESYVITKTFFKTNTEIDDEETFARFAQVFQNATEEVTGKRLTKAEKERLGELAELLATELKIAAARTSNVSSVPAFLTEHLRRRLWKTDKRVPGEEAKEESKASEPALSAEQMRACPDCGGSGMYYPEGYEKGVARCKHERLAPEGAAEGAAEEGSGEAGEGGAATPRAKDVV